ncbi:MAG: hypothetical protein PCFJNLEI_02667 [Verrucomicrobiae bacterium]|nr:hypothetical protein [Verrucomicrobiae bacterium]
MHDIATYTDIVYSRPPQRALRLDLRVPQAERRPPLIMHIPVGGLRCCDRAWTPWWLTDEGFAMASIETRVSPEVTAPAIVHDCKAAVRWLRANAERYGYAPDAIGVWGHSAGGLLASFLATSGDIAEVEGDGGHPGVSSRVQAACDQCGAPHDFSWFARPEIKSRFPGVVGNLRAYLGGLVEEKPELARQMSPQTYVSRNCPPVLLIHGENDDVVPVEETINFHQALTAVGVDSTLKILPGIGHGWDGALTHADIAAFFQRTLRP